jgi:Fe-S-cluster containining protein
MYVNNIHIDKRIMNKKGKEDLVKKISSGKKDIAFMKKVVDMDDTFKFKCTQCGKCCFNNEIALNIYDVIRLRHSLKKPTHFILKNEYLNFYIGQFSGIPVVSLNFIENKENEMRACAFYDDRVGCIVHKDKPIICKLYPLGRLQSIDVKTNEIEEIFVLQDDKETKNFCDGFSCKEKISVKDYLDSQDFSVSQEGSKIFTQIINFLSVNSFYAETSSNKDNKIKAFLKDKQDMLILLGNIMFNFDSFPSFQNDPIVIKTIEDTNATQEDFLYVMNKVFDVIKEFVNVAKKKEYDFEDYDRFIKFLIKGGDN